MRNVIYLSSFLGLLFACDNVNPSAALIQARSQTLDTALEFIEMYDPGLCNPDSIIASDCRSGSIQFKKDGKVIYEFSCAGEDSQQVDLGKYKLTDSGIYCVFEECYTYALPPIDADQEEETIREFTPVPGPVKKQETWDILIKMDGCHRFPWYNKYPELQDGASGMVFRKARRPNS